MVLHKQNACLIIALDALTIDEMFRFVDQLDPAMCRLKVGHHLYMQSGVLNGSRLIEELVKRGFDVFLDLKFHDIPETVAAACRHAAQLGVWMLNVHTLGGMNMLRAAREAIDESSRRPLLIGVTLLTSLMQEDVLAIGLKGSVADEVQRLAGLAREAGLDGVVCSAEEASMLKAKYGASFLLVTPGIRLPGEAMGDQKRVMTPEAAWQAGSDFIVMGRSIVGAHDPMKVIYSLFDKV